MQLKAQDILVALKLAAQGGLAMPYAEMAKGVGLSASGVHSSIRRLIEAKLVDNDKHQVRVAALRNFLVHGVPYVFPVREKEVTRGVPTGWAAPVMENEVQSGGQLPPVWPDPEGKVQGVAVKPLYPTVLRVIRDDPILYSLLALVDVLRIGRARERAIAERRLAELLPSHG